MIKTLELKNFRGIKEGKIELAPMTILLGPNNSGKTTILEALYLAPNPFREAPYSAHRVIGLIQSLHKTLESRGYLFLLRNYVSGKAEIKCDYVRGLRNILHFIIIKEDNKILVKSLTYGRTLGSLDIYSDHIHPKYDRPLFEDTLFYSSALRQEAFEYIKQNWISILNLGICRGIASETSNFVWEDYLDITVEPFTGQLAIYAYLKDGRRIRLGDLGEGVQNYMLIRILYEYEKPDILLWDDVEAHMNPKMLLGIGEWFSKLVEKGTQVIVATHSLEATKVLASLIMRTKICLTTLEDGILKVKSLTLEEVEGLLEAGIDVRASAEVLI